MITVSKLASTFGFAEGHFVTFTMANLLLRESMGNIFYFSVVPLNKSMVGAS